VFEDDIVHVTTISFSSLLQFTWQRGHYTWQPVVRDGFNTLQNSPF